MGACKGCNTVFSAVDMSYGYCKDCIETVDKEEAKDMYISETSKMVEFVDEKGNKKQIKLGSFGVSDFVEIYLLFNKDWKNFFIFFTLKIVAVFVALILVAVTGSNLVAALFVFVYLFAIRGISQRVYFISLLNNGFKPLDNANVLILKRIKVL